MKKKELRFDKIITKHDKILFDKGFQKAKEQYNELRIDRDKWMIKFAKQQEQYASALKKVKEYIYREMDSNEQTGMLEILNKHFGVLDNHSHPEERNTKLKGALPLSGSDTKEKGCGKGFTDDYFNDDWTCGEIVGGQIKLCSDCSKEKGLCKCGHDHCTLKVWEEKVWEEGAGNTTKKMKESVFYGGECPEIFCKCKKFSEVQA